VQQNACLSIDRIANNFTIACKQWSARSLRHAFRHHVNPGLSGSAQVNGHRGPTPTVDDIQRRVRFDLWYIDSWSLRLDLLSLIRTIIEVMRSRNAY
jgi:putative colanic acid biosynthesis UDP-glucose lipid carrier transferase